MLSRTAEYAVRATIVLASHFGERSVNVDEIASILGAPRNYLSKTLHALARRGILTSTRGPGGGFSLAVAPSVLTIADVVDVFAEAKPTLARCLQREAPCDPAHPCSAHQRWTQITLGAREALLRTVISELCGESRTQHATSRARQSP